MKLCVHLTHLPDTKERALQRPVSSVEFTLRQTSLDDDNKVVAAARNTDHFVKITRYDLLCKTMEAAFHSHKATAVEHARS